MTADTAAAFMPRWASPPGATLNDILHERNMTPAGLAEEIGVEKSAIEGLLTGDLRITVALARLLSESVGASVEFWLSRDAYYREDLERAAADRWASAFPVRQMASLGWIPSPSDWKEQLEICREFFNVSSLHDWEVRTKPILTAAYFRTAETESQRSMGVLAWLRQAEIVAEPQAIGQWQAAKFRAALEQARRLTRERNPSRFVPALTSLCAASGVRLAVVQSPQRCRVSGAARTFAGSPLITLSARYLTDDHFWFTFFHEAAHVLLHHNNAVFVDDDDELRANQGSSAEHEANLFAEQILVPGGLHGAGLSQWSSTREVIRKAQQLGVSPGILAGQMQYKGMARYDSHNGLKRRYKWVGANLEMA